jgi:hypothetical protein
MQKLGCLSLSLQLTAISLSDCQNEKSHWAPCRGYWHGAVLCERQLPQELLSPLQIVVNVLSRCTIQHFNVFRRVPGQMFVCEWGATTLAKS